MRTPLNSITGFSNLLSETELNEKQRKYVELIKFSSETLLSLINNVLEYSKLETSESKLIESEFKLYEEFLNSLSILEQKAINKNIKIDYYFDFTIPSVVIGDAFKLRRVIINLLDNAIKFSYENSNVIVSAELLCSVSSNKRFLITFSVIDHGIGIPKDKLSDIFKPFVQADMGFSRRYEGFGLGLSITKKIIDLMGGEIKVESEVNKGTNFTFSIPLTAKDSTQLLSKFENYLNFFRDSLFLIDEHLPISYLYLIQHLGLNVVAVSNLDEVLDFISKNRDKKILLLLSSSYLTGKCCKLEDVEKTLKGFDNVKAILFRFPQTIEPLKIDMKNFLTIEHPLNVFELFEILSESKERPEVKYDYETIKDTLETKKKVLVVEDNPVNSFLMVEILKKFSISPDVAYSGKECLEMVKIKDYDIIFMDVQMPDLDGYKLTSLIRSENLKSQPIIIGVSAHAYKEDIEEDLNLGMNDYITKPVRMNDIVRVLTQYLSKTSKELSTEKEKLPISDKVLDEDTMKKFLDLVGQNKFESFVRELLDSYLRTFNSEYSKLVKCNITKDLEGISKSAHKLKGASYELGFMKLGNVFMKIEDKAKNGINIISEELLKSIQELSEESLTAIEKGIKKYSS